MFSAQELSASQKQTHQLSRYLRESLDLLHMPVQELEQLLRSELAENPMLEECASEPEQNTSDGSENSDAADRDIEIDEWGDEVDIPDPERVRRNEELPDFWMNSPAPEPTLIEQLDAEIATSGCSSRMRELATAIVDALDDSGYLTTPLADIAMTENADMQEISEALVFVQSFDPPGVAARDLAECLRLQLERKNLMTPLLTNIIDSGLSDIENNRIPHLAKKLGVTLDELNSALALLRTLEPAPGSRTKQAEQVIPELEIISDGEGGFVPRLTREQTIRFGISPRYSRLLDDPSVSVEDRKYLRDKYESAREFLRSLELRKSTLLGIGEVICRTQKDFLERGPEYLHSLTMKQAAELLNLNESTVSRAVSCGRRDGAGSARYISTPHGVYPLKYFFSGGYTGRAGEDIGANAVREKLKELILSEDPRAPYSDEKLAGLLKEAGIPVARRTVAKYREAMKILPASMRRKY